jgi:hypothetical protein
MTVTDGIPTCVRAAAAFLLAPIVASLASR